MKIKLLMLIAVVMTAVTLISCDYGVWEPDETDPPAVTDTGDSVITDAPITTLPPVTPQQNEVIDLILAFDYTGAKALFDKSFADSESLKENIKATLEAQIDGLFEYCVSDACNDVSGLAKYDGLDLFPDIESALLLRLGSVKTEYADGKYTYEQGRKLITQVCALSYLTDNKDELLSGIASVNNDYIVYQSAVNNIAENNIQIAYEQLNRIADASPLYSKAQAKLDWIATDYKSSELQRCKDIYGSGKYADAYNALKVYCAIFTSDTEAASLLESYKQKALTEYYEYPVSSICHFFTHCLVAFPQITLSKYASSPYDIDCITPKEFKAIIQSLYDKNYMLIDINEIYDIHVVDGVEKAKLKKTITVPKGKIPCIISVDDVVYDARKMGQGMVDKLVVKDGRLATYTKHSNGVEVYSYDNEVFTILEGFCMEHPDFSLNGAKCTLALTGFQGILGYRTQETLNYNTGEKNPEANRQKEIAECKVVIDYLKSHGFNFASHSFGHYYMENISLSMMQGDIEAWEEQVVSLVGPTNIYIYPFGSWAKYSTDKHQALLSAGFKVFCGCSSVQFMYSGFPFDNTVGNVFMDRITIDGRTLRNNREKYLKYFDSYEVYDHDNRFVLFDESNK